MSQMHRSFKCVKSHLFFFKEGRVFPEIKTVQSGSPLIENTGGPSSTPTRWVLSPLEGGFWFIKTAGNVPIATFREVGQS